MFVKVCDWKNQSYLSILGYDNINKHNLNQLNIVRITFMQGKDVVLGLLNNKELTGYEIKEIFESQLKYFFDGSFGMIYPLLRKLEKQGFIKKRRVLQTNKPNKNVYSITSAGKKEFHNYLASETADEVYKSDFLMRLYFGRNLKKEKIRELIQLEISKKENNLDELTRNYEKWKTNGMDSLQEITYKYGISYYQTALKVLREALKEFTTTTE